MSEPGFATARRVPGDVRVLTIHYLNQYRRDPSIILSSVVLAVIFVLLFDFVFGGAVAGSNDGYVNFLIPAVMIQSAIFGTIQSGIALATDLSTGVVERLHTLPIARGAVIVARLFADTIRTLVILATAAGVGFAIGFSPSAGLARFALTIAVGLALSVPFQLATSWLGVALRRPDVVEQLAFAVIFPATFASSVFVPLETLPTWAQPVLRHNPISVAADLARGLAHGGPIRDGVIELAIVIVVSATLLGLGATRSFARMFDS